MSEQAFNDFLVLIGGKSGTGKSASLKDLENHKGVMYLNCESGKKLPFRNEFDSYVITDPMQIIEAIDHAETDMPHIHTIVVDTLTYLLDMYESLNVLTSDNTMAAWSDFQQYFKNLMQQHVAKSTKNIIFLAHTADSLNDKEMVMETKVPVKGALKNNGIESYFSLVLAAKTMKLKDLEGYQSDLLNITPEDEIQGFKHVYQTRLTKDTTGERIRGPMGLFSIEETYIDNNIQLVLNRLREYYGVPQQAEVA